MKKKKNKKAGGAAKKDKDESKPEGEPSQSPPPADDAAADETPENEAADQQSSPKQTSSQQSKLRSASFRAGSAPGNTPLSPTSEGGETAADIYRKQVARIEDLEKENKRLAKEAGDSEKRWQKAEEELADLKTSDGKAGTGDDQVEKLVCNPFVNLD
jgi:hypothetical protein